MRIDCGTDDCLLEQNREFHKHLETLHIPHEYEEFPGAHDWAYWDSTSVRRSRSTSQPGFEGRTPREELARPGTVGTGDQCSANSRCRTSR